MSRYQNEGTERMNNPPSKQLSRTAPFFAEEVPKAFNGTTWDARHMTKFINRSNYSNWKGDKPNISRNSQISHKRSYSTKGDHFFKTTKDDKNQSKIGFTPIFPLVSIAPLQPEKGVTLTNFFKSSEDESGKNVQFRCSPDSEFRYEGNAVKFKRTDPITMSYEYHPMSSVNGFQKQRMNRLIERRHPHGMTGIDHPQNPQTKYYQSYQQKIRIRQQPNSHRTFLLDRDWKEKKRSVPPIDEWKQRKGVTIRKFRNENVHGYNILTNRLLQ